MDNSIRDRTNSLADAIRDFPIVSWLSDHFSVTKSNGEDCFVDCFDCGKKNGIAVSTIWKSAHCFSCDPAWGGKGSLWDGKAHLIKLIALVERCSTREAIQLVKKLAGYPDIDLPKRVVEAEEFPKEAIPLKDLPADNKAIVFLRDVRKVPQLIEDSFVCVSGRYADRVLMPTRWFDQITGFEAKSYYKSVHPKSLFPRNLATSNTLYTSKKWNHDLDFCVITESLIDAETLQVNALGSYGSGFKEGHLKKLLDLRHLGIKRLFWMLDADMWYKQGKTIMQNTSLMFENYYVPVPEGEDPNSLGTLASWDCVDKAFPFRDEFDLISVFCSK